MALAKVWNDYTVDFKGEKVTKPYVEKFRDEKIEIPPGKFIEMDKFDALQFVGQYTPVRKDGLGNDLQPKKLRVELIPEKEAAKPVEIKCMACQGKFDTDKELALHTDAYHKDQIVKELKK